MRRKGSRQNKADGAEQGRLLARPTPPSMLGPLGLQSLGLHTTRDGLRYVPSGYRPNQPAPLVVLCHGAGGEAYHGLHLLQAFADDTGVILLAPQSQRQTWDVIMGGYGPDIQLINQALAQTFEQYAVDPTRIAVGGFSDGASYALGVGITNGDLFTHILAWAPGFMAPTAQRGTPHIFISHGTHDAVLPIERCSRRLVPQLEQAGYDVLYREFDGPHTVPPNLARAALDWFLQSSGS